MSTNKKGGIVVVASSIDKRIGSRLKTRRTYLGITQSSLGSMLGVTFQQVQKYEKGVNKISISKLQELSKILGVPMGYFINDDKKDDRDDSFSPETEEETSEAKDISCDASSSSLIAGEIRENILISELEGEGGKNEVSEREIVDLIKAFRRIKNKKTRNLVMSLMYTMNPEANTIRKK